MKYLPFPKIWSMSASWNRRKFIRYSAGSVGCSLLPASLAYAFPVHAVMPVPVAKEPLRLSVDRKSTRLNSSH